VVFRKARSFFCPFPSDVRTGPQDEVDGLATRESIGVGWELRDGVAREARQQVILEGVAVFGVWGVHTAGLQSIATSLYRLTPDSYPPNIRFPLEIGTIAAWK
jgi:hypothetical protein